MWLSEEESGRREVGGGRGGGEGGSRGKKGAATCRRLGMKS